MKRPQTEKEFGKIVENWTAWLVARGAEVLAITNPYELIRFTAPEGVAIVYRDGKGNVLEKHWINGARRAFDSWISGTADWRMTKRERRKAKQPREVRAILARDGARCFYCRKPFSDERPPTREHFVAVTHGGPNHLSNLALAHVDCNTLAGHLSVAEKLELAIRMRAEHGELSARDSTNGAQHSEIAGEASRGFDSRLEESVRPRETVAAV